MGARSLEILVLTDEPCHAAYLRTVLQLELPGCFEVRQADGQGARPCGHADLVLLLAKPGPTGEIGVLPALAEGAGRPPVIVVASGPLDLASVGRLIQDGADDVIDLARLTPRGLAGAVLKAVRRRRREAALAGPFAIAAAWPHEGVLASG